jgi:hypothetical protein
MWAAGYIVAPVLFKTLAPDNILAGNIAGQIFAVIAWIGLVTASYLLVFIFATKGRAALREKRFWCVAVMLVCVAVGYFGIQWEMAALKAGVGSMDVMESAARGKFALLHGLSEAIYLVQSLLGAWLAITLNKNL